MANGTVRLQITVPSAVFTVQKKNLRKALRQAGNEVAAATRAQLRQAAGAGRLYRGPGGSAAAYRGGYKAGAYRASAPGSAPVRVTGFLANSIKVLMARSGESVAIRDAAFYALFLEHGAKGGGNGKATRNRRGKPGSIRVLEPHPFLTTALAAREPGLTDRLGTALRNDIAFVRVKP